MLIRLLMVLWLVAPYGQSLAESADSSVSARLPAAVSGAMVNPHCPVDATDAVCAECIALTCCVAVIQPDVGFFGIVPVICGYANTPAFLCLPDFPSPIDHPPQIAT